MGSVKECAVITIHRLEGAGNLRAFVDIRIGGALEVRGCTVMEGRNGIFASLPRRIGKDGKWIDVVTAANEELRSIYQEEILRAYGNAEPE